MTLLRLSNAELHFATQVVDNLTSLSQKESVWGCWAGMVLENNLFKRMGEQQLDDGERWLDPRGS